MDDGYPNEEEINRIKDWDTIHDGMGMIEYVGALWTYPDRFIKRIKTEEWGGKREIAEYYFSTGGWSGNEDLINALMENKYFHLFYHTRWERGGHWWFEVPIKTETPPPITKPKEQQP